MGTGAWQRLTFIVSCAKALQYCRCLPVPMQVLCHLLLPRIRVKEWKIMRMHYFSFRRFASKCRKLPRIPSEKSPLLSLLCFRLDEDISWCRPYRRQAGEESGTTGAGFMESRDREGSGRCSFRAARLTGRETGGDAYRKYSGTAKMTVTYVHADIVFQGTADSAESFCLRLKRIERKSACQQFTTH